MAIVTVATLSLQSLERFSSRGASRFLLDRSRQVACFSNLKTAPPLQSLSDLNLIKSQVRSGMKMKTLGERLQEARFEATALDGKATVSYDGLQELRSVHLDADAIQTAGGPETFSKALLSALQQAHDASTAGSQGDVWQLYQQNPDLIQAPLTQIGAGNTQEDLWVNVSKTDDSVKLAQELFERFDEDKDGFWNLQETSTVQLATEGSQMAEEAFTSLIIAAAPEGGRKLTEDDLMKGLSRDQVIELYTNAERQRQLGFVLDIYKDHAKVFQEKLEDAPKKPAMTAMAD